MFENLMNIECSCGKNHSLTTRIFEVGKNAMEKLPDVLERLDASGTPLAVYDANTYKAAGEKLSTYLPSADTLILEGEKIRPDEMQIAAIEEAAPGHSVLLAVGSGVVTDLVRYVAFRLGLPFVSVPTAASVDGFVSDSSAMTLHGSKVTLPTKAPAAVVADLEIISHAPMRLTASGVGDMLSKYISIADWKIGHLTNGEYYCDSVANLEQKAVDLIVDNIDAIAHGDVQAMGYLMEGLLLSGAAMQLVGITRPASSFEHHFSHFLETVPVGGAIDVDALHGEKVGVATVYAAKYYPVFARALRRIFEENLSNQFDLESVKRLYEGYPASTVEWVEKENSPTITASLDPALLEQNYDKIVSIADAVPGPEQMRRVLQTVGGLTDYKDLHMTPEEFRSTMEICCYIRNRYTMLRLVCDYDLFDFETMDD